MIGPLPNHPVSARYPPCYILKMHKRQITFTGIVFGILHLICGCHHASRSPIRQALPTVNEVVLESVTPTSTTALNTGSPIKLVFHFRYVLHGASHLTLKFFQTSNTNDCSRTPGANNALVPVNDEEPQSIPLRQGAGTFSVESQWPGDTGQYLSGYRFHEGHLTLNGTLHEDSSDGIQDIDFARSFCISFSDARHD